MKTLGKSPHVLVVDDETAVCETVAGLLISHGYIVSKASSGEDALEVLERSEVNLVVLDFDLGSDTGLDLLQIIKDSFPSTYVIMLTGRGYDEEAWQAARERGAHGYLSKTLPPAQLLSEVDRWLRFKK